MSQSAYDDVEPGAERQLAAAVLAERERCARIAEEFDDFVYDGRKVEGRHYAMINGRESARKIAEEIRKVKP